MMVVLTVFGDISAGSQRRGVYKHKAGQNVDLLACVGFICMCTGQGSRRWGDKRLEAHPASDWVFDWTALFSL